MDSVTECSQYCVQSQSNLLAENDKLFIFEKITKSIHVYLRVMAWRTNSFFDSSNDPYRTRTADKSVGTSTSAVIYAFLLAILIGRCQTLVPLRWELTISAERFRLLSSNWSLYPSLACHFFQCQQLYRTDSLLERQCGRRNGIWLNLQQQTKFMFEM